MLENIGWISLFSILNKIVINFANYQIKEMAAETICIPAGEYKLLKKKEAVADDILLQLEASLKDLEAGRVKLVR